MTTPRRLLLAAPALLMPAIVRATPEEMAQAVRAFTSGAPVRPGRVALGRSAPCNAACAAA